MTPDLPATPEEAYEEGRRQALAAVQAVATEHRERADVLAATGHPEPAYDRHTFADAIDAAVEHVRHHAGGAPS